MTSIRPSPGQERAHAAVIFDFEGTLVDFQWQLKVAETALRQAFSALGLEGDEFTHGNYATMWNAAMDQLAPQGRIDELRRALCPIYDEWDADALRRWAPRAQAAEVLRALAERGLPIGMVSNVGRRALDIALTRFDFAGALAPVVTRDDVSHMKPRAAGILQVLAGWNQVAGSVLFVGDSRADVCGARAAGLPVAIIRGGECDETAFAADPPDYMISGLDELLGLFAVTKA